MSSSGYAPTSADLRFDCSPLEPDFDFTPPPPVPLSSLKEYVEGAKKNDADLFKAEFEALPKGKQYPSDDGDRAGNSEKNRYPALPAYDHSRVILEPEAEGDVASAAAGDYVNASYLPGFQDEMYVACQGPVASTVVDMWRLVWQLHANRIVMLTTEKDPRGKCKCERYWPQEVGQSTHYGSIHVTTIQVQEHPDYVIRTFLVTKPECPARTVRHFHYLSWPDMQTPAHPAPLLAFRQKLRAHDVTTRGPIVAHCSAGVGRTGTFLALDAALAQAHSQHGAVDVWGLVERMRTHRINMVETLDQYKFIYDALVVASEGFPDLIDARGRKAIQGDGGGRV